MSYTRPVNYSAATIFFLGILTFFVFTTAGTEANASGHLGTSPRSGEGDSSPRLHRSGSGEVSQDGLSDHVGG